MRTLPLGERKPEPASDDSCLSVHMGASVILPHGRPGRGSAHLGAGAAPGGLGEKSSLFPGQEEVGLLLLRGKAPSPSRLLWLTASSALAPHHFPLSLHFHFDQPAAGRDPGPCERHTAGQPLQDTPWAQGHLTPHSTLAATPRDLPLTFLETSFQVHPSLRLLLQDLKRKSVAIPCLLFSLSLKTGMQVCHVLGSL